MLDCKGLQDVYSPVSFFSQYRDIAMRRDEIIWRIVDNEALLLDTDSGNYFCLSESGTKIWNLLEENKSVDEIARIFANEYQIDVETAKSDILQFIEQLQENKIIEQ